MIIICKKCLKKFNKTDRLICKKCQIKQVIEGKNSDAQKRYRASEKYKSMQKVCFKNFYNKNRDSQVERVSSVLKRERLMLHDNYIKKQLRKSGFSNESLKNKELIKTKKILIKTKRLWKTSQN